MTRTLKPWVAATLLVPVLTGCIDNSYDLDNINTDVEVKVNDLVIPVNLDAITLSNAFDLNDDSAIKEVDGEYAVSVDGEFTSDPINVAKVEINPGNIDPIVCQIFKYEGGGVDIPSFTVSGQTINYEITPATTPFSFSCDNVDKSIRKLTKVKGNWTIKVNMNLTDANRLFNALEFQKLVLELPAGIHVSNYPCADGKVSVGLVKINLATVNTVTLLVDEIDFSVFDTNAFKFTAATGDLNNGKIEFNGTVGVLSGYVVGGTNDTNSRLPQDVTLNIAPVMGTINVSSVTGAIGYKVTGFNVDNVELSDLPDMLRQEGTNVTIANPQLYLSLNNPVADYKLTASSGLTLTAMKDNVAVNTCSLNAGQEINLGCDKGVEGPYPYCLAPTDPKSYIAGYSGASYVGYSSLSKLLSGDGLPDYIKVNFDNTRVNEGPVTDFLLDTTIPSIRGTYELYAPLQLGVNSTIVYKEQETGWSDETLEKITITKLTVTATVTNSLPADITVWGKPLDVYGNPIKDASGKEVMLEGLKVAAGATSAVTLENTGVIKGLDGILYEASCVVTKDGQVLKPTETIELKNIRVKVSGNYIDTL